MSLGLAVLAGCKGADPSPAQPNTNNVVKSDKTRLSASSVPPADVAQQSADDSKFAFDLYGQLKGTPGNLFFSPYSISSALAMTWAGAATTTSTAMAQTLHFSMPGDRVHGAFNALDVALADRANDGTSTTGGPFKLNVANAVWAQQGFALQAPFLDTLAQNYGAGVHTEDFKTQAEPARLDINAWVSQQTAGLIPELLAQGDVNAGTKLVLTNAVYFNGSWSNAFHASETHDQDFHQLDGSTKQVPLMHQDLRTQLGHGAGFTTVEVPYSNRDLTLTLIVPDSGQFNAVESQLSAAFVDAAVAGENYAEVAIGLPKFSMKTSATLAQPLSALGMGEAFSERADFSGIDGAHDLAIGDVVHQATITIDEAGTQAAAATAVTIGTTSVGPQPVALEVDRPFILVLRDVPTGAVLFVGRVTQL